MQSIYAKCKLLFKWNVLCRREIGVAFVETSHGRETQFRTTGSWNSGTVEIDSNEASYWITGGPCVWWDTRDSRLSFLVDYSAISCFSSGQHWTVSKLNRRSLNRGNMHWQAIIFLILKWSLSQPPACETREINRTFHFLQRETKFWFQSLSEKTAADVK